MQTDKNFPLSIVLLFGIVLSGCGGIFFADAASSETEKSETKKENVKTTVPKKETLKKEAAPATKFSKEQIAFFTTKVRPLLEARCFKCHSANSKSLKGELRVDSRIALLKGGESGPAIVPGQLDKSPLIEAIRYDGLEMPPKTKMPKGEIAILEKWVKMGAPWTEETATTLPKVNASFPLEARKQKHWAWKQLTNPPIPRVNDPKKWAETDIDRFVLKKLNEKKLAPTTPASRSALIRRAYFDLIGLPPTIAELNTFINDPASDETAFAKVIDTLLKSPHFGERWGRHWLDLMRYGDTLGHEYDFLLEHAHHYRDYVIRAFNADVSYKQFVTEHLAGDLLNNPRRHPKEGYNESLIGTGFWFLGENMHAPVDVRDHEAKRIDNQIDVFSKTFLGLTVSCARCHDHKFDAISTKDFYALAGFLQSSSRDIGLLDAHQNIRKKMTALQQLHNQGTKEFHKLLPSPTQINEKKIAQQLLAAYQFLQQPTKQQTAKSLAKIARKEQLKTPALKKLIDTLKAINKDDLSHPLWTWAMLSRARQPNKNFAQQKQAVNQQLQQHTARHQKKFKDTQLFADFNSSESLKNWTVSGDAFNLSFNNLKATNHSRTWNPNSTVPNIVQPGILHSGLLSNRALGTLRSPTFTITHDTIHYHLAASGSKKSHGLIIYLVIDGYRMTPHKNLLFMDTYLRLDTGGQWKWISLSSDISRFKNHRAHIEIIDQAADGWVAIDQIHFSNTKRLVEIPRRLDLKSPAKACTKLRIVPMPSAVNPITKSLLQNRQLTTAAQFANHYATHYTTAIARWKKATPKKQVPKKTTAKQQHQTNVSDVQLINSAFASGLFPAPPKNHPLQKTAQKIRTAARQIPVAQQIIAIADKTGEDEYVFIRGSHKNRGPTVPRRFLEALSRPNEPIIKTGSGRAELVRRLFDPSNPFPSRVMANRIWHHLFGRGIVASVDNFGVLGQKPTHPELLDHLASSFIKNGWSVKQLIRRIMLSKTYRLNTVSTPQAEQADPENRFLHRASRRRLQGEVIRDAILKLSGRFNDEQFGPGVPVYLTPFMNGRGRPKKSGPLDGNGRRSIYLEMRRNFLNPMLLAFDLPLPVSTIGRRNQSNVPAQSLILMNHPFILQQAERWAKQLLSNRKQTPEERIHYLYKTALSRPATAKEVAQAIGFLKQQTQSHNQKPDGWKTDPKAWADYCHVIFNLKEFIFLR